MSKHGDNIWKRKDGRWEARFVKGHNPNGKTLYGSVYGKSFSEVKRKREEVLLTITREQVPPSSTKALSVIAEEFLEYHRFEIKYSTYVRYVEIVQNHLSPDLGLISVSDFSQEDGNEYVRKLLSSGKAPGSGLAPKTVKDIVSVLKLILKYAEKKKYISNAPTDFSVPKLGHSPIMIFAPSQIEKLEEFVCTTSDAYKFGVYLCLYTGLRIGEVCALQWRDVDCNNSIISINKTVLRVKNVYGTTPKTKLIINSPKTHASDRIIPLPYELNEKLQTLKETTASSEDSYVLTGTARFIEPRNYYEKYKRYLRKCELDGFDFHALRHTFATRCIETGIDPKVLSEILGHASVQITLDRYVHPSLETKRMSLCRLFSSN